MDAAMRYLTSRARTKREMERYLDDCQYGEVEVMETVQRLEELNLIDDQAFAREFIRTRLNTKPVSRGHLKAQLKAHEVEEAAMEQALQEVCDQQEVENAVNVAKKYLRQLAGLPLEERENRTIRRLLARGYDYDTAKDALSLAAEDGEET